MTLSSALLFVAWMASGVQAEKASEGHQQAVAAIRALGGKVVEGNTPGSPVTVGLTGARGPAECLPHLKRIVNLCTLDL